MRYHVPIRLRWADLDAYNHVNNSRLLSLLEEARIRAIWSTEDSEVSPLAVIEGLQGSATQTLVARHEIEYTAPIPYQSKPIDVQLWVGRLGAASCDICYEIWSPAGETGEADTTGRTRYVIASTTVVFMDAATQRPRRINERERAAWGPYMEPPVVFRGAR